MRIELCIPLNLHNGNRPVFLSPVATVTCRLVALSLQRLPTANLHKQETTSHSPLCHQLPTVLNNTYRNYYKKVTATNMYI